MNSQDFSFNFVLQLKHAGELSSFIVFEVQYQRCELQESLVKFIASIYIETATDQSETATDQSETATDQSETATDQSEYRLNRYRLPLPPVNGRTPVCCLPR